ncbi:hypothetical protein HNQ36_003042 [Afipia massiliensis]|uniref:Uncharacterized protein n=1 Tax=Afipia massiliensis TaxID=211460 RepID=A0A840N5K4_9BRAD|nr:hypothetical protein [Afipia massiliensis]MBB5053051.1 hypothetical protein [Afipia massiliensis]
MIDNKQDCLDHLAYRLSRSSEWRTKQSERFSDDPRNKRAAARLKDLAANCRIIPDSKWLKLAPYFDPTNNRWLDAVSNTSGDVGFRKTPADFDGYLDNLISNLSRPTRH